MDVANWLQNLGLEQYEAAFRENGLNAEILRTLPRMISKISALPPSATGANYW
jgi:hypothetical protein